MKPRTGIPFYLIRNGRGFWNPTKRMKAQGFASVACGPDGPDAWEIAEKWNRRWQSTRKHAKPPSPLVHPSRDDSAEHGYIYFIKAGDRVKIGFSTNPFYRTSQLHAGIADHITLVAAIPGTRNDERRLHNRLRQFRRGGEWFLAAPRVMFTVRRSIEMERPFHSDLGTNREELSEPAEPVLTMGNAA